MKNLVELFGEKSPQTWDDQFPVFFFSGGGDMNMSFIVEI